MGYYDSIDALFPFTSPLQWKVKINESIQYGDFGLVLILYELSHGFNELSCDFSEEQATSMLEEIYSYLKKTVPSRIYDFMDEVMMAEISHSNLSKEKIIDTLLTIKRTTPYLYKLIDITVLAAEDEYWEEASELGDEIKNYWYDNNVPILVNRLPSIVVPEIV